MDGWMDQIPPENAHYSGSNVANSTGIQQAHLEKFSYNETFCPQRVWVIDRHHCKLHICTDPVGFLRVWQQTKRSRNSRSSKQCLTFKVNLSQNLAHILISHMSFILSVETNPPALFHAPMKQSVILAFMSFSAIMCWTADMVPRCHWAIVSWAGSENVMEGKRDCICSVCSGALHVTAEI